MSPGHGPRHPYRTRDCEDGAGGDDPDGGELVRLRGQPVEVGVLHHGERPEAQMAEHHDERERPRPQPEPSHDASRISLRSRARSRGSSSTRSTNRASAASPNSASTPRTAISAVSATTGVYTNPRPSCLRARIPLPANRDSTVITVVYANGTPRSAFSRSTTSRTDIGVPAAHSTPITSASNGPSPPPPLP